jgi:exodeoxyribonuclease-3
MSLKKLGAKKNNMKLISWNVNGIRAVLRKGEIQKLLTDLDPDVLVLQEIKAKEDQIDYNFDGYHVNYNSALKPGYSGTAIFSKIKPLRIIKDIPAEIEEKYSLTDKFGNTNTEGRVIVAEFENYFIVSIYTPMTKRDLGRHSMRSDHWDPAFLEYMNQLKKTKPVLFGGDLNVAHKEIDLARPKDNVNNPGFTIEERNGADNIVNSGFVDSFRLLYPDKKDIYSWWVAWGNARSKNIGWRIDYWFIDEKLKNNLIEADILNSQMGSDHCPVLVELDL